MAVLTTVALIFACLGAGRALLNTSDSPTRAGPDGIAGLTGLALLTWLAGWIVLAGAYSKAVGWGLLTLGCIALLLRGVGARAPGAGENRQPPRLDMIAVVLGLLSLGLMLGRAFGELIVPFVEPGDDWPSYWHFPRLMLESGSFIEPFGLRRLTALGAATFAQSFFWPGFRIAANGMTDAVLGQLALWAAVRVLPDALAARPQPAWKGEALALAALLVSLTIPSPNSQPTLLPMAGALALILLTRRMTVARTLGVAIAWGLVAAWLIGLRTSNVAFPAGLWLVSALVAARLKDREQALRLGLAGLATLVGLLPWCLELWQSSGTPLYPLIAGNYRFEGGLYSVPLDWPSLIALVGDRLWVSRVWILAALGLVAALKPGVRLLSVQVVAALLLLVAGSAAATTGLDAITIHRLSAPFLAAGVIFFTAAILVTDPASPEAGHPAPRWNLQPLALWAGLVLWFALPVTLPLDAWQVPASNRSMFEYQGIRRINAALIAWRLEKEPDERYREAYEAAQALLPADARLLSIAERPYLFRFDRQVVHTLDFVGSVSPAPGMPFFKGPEALAQYLRARGYTHLALRPVVLDDNSEPSVKFASPMANDRKLWPYAGDFRENTERLAGSYPVVYWGPELIVISLHKPRPGDTRKESG